LYVDAALVCKDDNEDLGVGVEKVKVLRGIMWSWFARCGMAEQV